MPREAYKTCKGCGRSSEEAGSLSWTRLCVKCAEVRYTDNLLELAAHKGPYFEHWRHGVAASVGGVIPPRRPQPLDATTDAT